MEEIDASGFDQKWQLDPKGYFLIRIDRNSQTIEVGHCLENNNVLRVIKGKTPEEIMYKVIDQNLISLLDHAAYLGKELQKAYIALKYNLEYIQDSEIKNNLLIIRHRVNSIQQLLETPKKYGVEIDIRAFGSKLILNHEPHENGEDFEEYLKNFDHAFVIFNIKEAGIEQEVIDLAKKYNIKDYFLLDVEFPFIFKATRQLGFKKIAIRYSEAEPIEMVLEQKNLAEWVWVDVNTRLPLDKEIYKQLKQAGFKICLVCPERWGRPEDIENYIDILKQNEISIDAVMTSLECAEKWEKL